MSMPGRSCGGHRSGLILVLGMYVCVVSIVNVALATVRLLFVCQATFAAICFNTMPRATGLLLFTACTHSRYYVRYRRHGLHRCA
ncbi:hypothetical protein GGS24DRAFT_477748 [Hypoxylon argillaceum]|nr:hypothetical protein GGS24DRAFT_477748 [Hypoxylon argillaceum]